MTAAATRARLGVAAAALGRADGPPRTQRLKRALAGTPRPALSFEAVTAAPEFLLQSAAARLRQARQAALIGIAPQLAASIDGGWLRDLAGIAGAEALDIAIARGASAPDALPPFPGDALDDVAADILHAATPPALRPLLGSERDGSIDPVTAVALLERAA